MLSLALGLKTEQDHNCFYQRRLVPRGGGGGGGGGGGDGGGGGGNIQLIHIPKRMLLKALRIKGPFVVFLFITP